MDYELYISLGNDTLHIKIPYAMNPLQKRIRKKRLELLIAFIGYLIGIGLGSYFIILLFIYWVSK